MKEWEMEWMHDAVNDRMNRGMSDGGNDTHAAAHVGESLLRSLYPALSHTDGEGSRDVWTELYRDTDRLKHEQWNHDLSETLCSYLA